MKKIKINVNSFIGSMNKTLLSLKILDRIETNIDQGSRHFTLIQHKTLPAMCYNFE